MLILEYRRRETNFYLNIHGIGQHKKNMLNHKLPNPSYLTTMVLIRMYNAGKR